MQPKLKILHMISGLKMGGAEMTLYKLLSCIDHRRYDNCIVSLTAGGVIADQINSLGYRVECCDLKQVLSAPATLMKLRKIVRSYKPDVIQCWMYHGNLVGTLLQSIVSRRSLLVWNIRHSLISLQSNRFMTRQVIKLNKLLSSRPQTIIYNSSRVAAEHEAYGFDGKAARIISNGFDTQLFRPDHERRTVMRASLGIGSDQMVIGYVARYHPVKDHDNLCDAISRLVKNNKKLSLVLAGKDVVPQNQALMKIIKKYQLENNILLLGEYDKVECLIPAFDIACSPSGGESFPNSVGEAMACGIPCVVTDVGQCGEIIGDTGYLVAPGKPIELAEALHAMIALGPDGRRSLGEKARARILENYSLMTMKTNYEMLYSSQFKKSTTVNMLPVKPS